MSSTNRGAKREPRDFYETPRDAVWSLLDVIADHFRGLEQHHVGDCYRWLEPAVGNGAIIKAVREHKSNLPIVWDAVDIKPGVTVCADIKNVNTGSYLDYKHKTHFALTITNPPFSLAQEFIAHALSHPYQRIAMLLRVGLLESIKRSEWWQGKEPHTLAILSKRPDFTGAGGDSCAYGWFLWNFQCEVYPGVVVLPPQRNTREGVGRDVLYQRAFLGRRRNGNATASAAIPVDKQSSLLPPSMETEGWTNSITAFHGGGIQRTELNQLTDEESVYTTKEKTMPTKSKQTTIPVLVTTEHKGVFFGFAKEDKPDNFKSIRLEDAQLCVYWSTDVRGFMGLAATGPSKNCKIGPVVPAITITDVTSVAVCSNEAAEAWKTQGERKWG